MIVQTLIDLFTAGISALRDYFILARFISLSIAFSLSGAIVAFMSQGAVIRFFGPKANKWLSYLVASVSGAVLTVCSCSVLPMFASIRKKGAGIGPAIAFLFSGPAINILAITMTFSLIGIDIGFARVFGAVFLALLIGFLMFVIFRKSEIVEADARMFDAIDTAPRPWWQNTLFFTTLLSVLVLWYVNPYLTLIMAVVVLVQAFIYFTPDELRVWGFETLTLAKKIIPLFIIGIFLAGVIGSLLSEALMVSLVGENTYLSNLLASVFGAFMYFATLTEVPIVTMFIDRLSMHRGPAVALLLAGPTLSLPNMIVISRVLGVKKSTAFFTMVVIFSAAVGLIAGLVIGG